MVEWVHVGMWRAYGLYGAYGIEADLGITRGFREGFGLAPGEVWKVSSMAEICFLFKHKKCVQCILIQEICTYLLR